MILPIHQNTSTCMFVEKSTLVKKAFDFRSIKDDQTKLGLSSFKVQPVIKVDIGHDERLT